MAVLGDGPEVVFFMVGGGLGGNDGTAHAVHGIAQGGGGAAPGQGFPQHSQGQQALFVTAQALGYVQ